MENERTCKRLSELGTSDSGVITKVLGHGSFRKRITEMGFVRGKRVTVIKNAPFLDPVEYEIMGYHIALRRSEADLIEVSRTSGPGEEAEIRRGSTFEDAGINRFLHESGRTINVALVGNPNSGKTSLFNVASGAHEHVGNYSGVTVDVKHGVTTRGGYTIRLADLPGTYSITEYTPEELYVRTHILNEMPDVVINVIDASNLERNLFLTTQLIDMNLKVVIALNMYDELEATGARFDYEALGRMIGIPVVPTIASRGEGIDRLFGTVIDVFEDNEPTVRHIHINYGADIEASILVLQELIWLNCDVVAHYSSRYLAIKLLENDRQTLRMLEGVETVENGQQLHRRGRRFGLSFWRRRHLHSHGGGRTEAGRPGGISNMDDIKVATRREIAKLERAYGDKVESVIADAKYGFIAGALSETLTPGTGDNHHRATRIDRIFTHRIWGFPIFVLIMWIMFQTTFSLGSIPAGWIESGVASLSEWIGGILPEGSFRDLLTDGILGGVGGVIVFLPNILILFFFISFMEDTGYMARTAFIMDRFMHKIGLHGKSFIPLLMGFGCNVPAIMATRTLESRKDRLLTMLILPFMSCSARLPVYVLLISAFFPKGQGLVLLSIYLLGILVAIISSLMLKRMLFRKAEAPFVMELPPYRIPTARSVVRHMWSKGVQYLRKMGTVILVASVLIWALSTYPQPDGDATSQQRQENSYIGRMGHTVEPVIRPLGFDWKIGVSLVSGLAAKEIVVSTMGVLSGATEPEAVEAESAELSGGDEELALVKSLQQEVYTSGPRVGEKVYSPLVAYNMMVFILLYFPCIAAIAAIRKEAGRRWALFTVFYTTGLAWLVCFMIYQVANFF